MEADLLYDWQHPWLAAVVTVCAYAQVDLVRIFIGLVCCRQLEYAAIVAN